METSASHAREDSQVDAGPHGTLSPTIRASLVLGQVSYPVQFLFCRIEVDLILSVRFAQLGCPHFDLVAALFVAHHCRRKCSVWVSSSFGLTLPTRSLNGGLLCVTA